MKDTKEMLARQVNTLRLELERTRERNTFLESDVERSHAQTEIEARRRSVIEEQRNAAWRERDEARQHPPLFERMSFEKFTRVQLVSFIEQAINEARRKGMMEAEGLLDRHRELSKETDIEMMSGVIRTYQARITELSNEKTARARAAQEPVKLDTRPLAEKIQPAGKRAVLNPSWWQSDFTEFDRRASVITEEAKAKTPGTLTDRQVLYVMGDTGHTYTLNRNGDVYSCSCPAWTHQTAANNRRTCKHLKRHLGTEAEEKRVAQPPVLQRSCWCGVLLVRGQCQIHTNRWAGDERCNCGRLFSHCKEEFSTGRAPTREWHEPRLFGTPEPARLAKARQGLQSYN